jgi:hypothetical protein
MEEKAKTKNKLDYQGYAYILLVAAVLTFAVLYILEHGGNQIMGYELKEAKAEADSAKAEKLRQRQKDSSTISKLQTRLKDAEKASAELQGTLKDLKERLERIETNTQTILKVIKRPHFFSEKWSPQSPQSYALQSSTRHPPAVREDVIQTSYNPGVTDTIYVKVPVYYHYKEEYTMIPMDADRKPSWLGVGPSIGVGVNRSGEFMAYLGVGINFNILRYRY